jgi:hypothetical protein
MTIKSISTKTKKKNVTYVLFAKISAVPMHDEGGDTADPFTRFVEMP